MRSAALAAAAGGVTTIIARPDTLPPIDAPEALEFVTRRATDQPVRIRHQAALTRAREGREMVEKGFLLDAGALAFTDGVRVVENTKLLSRCMSYAKGLGALIVGHPQDAGLSRGAAATSAFCTWKKKPRSRARSTRRCRSGSTRAMIRRLAMA